MPARCLAIDAPAAEDKLACLSEIAQEHGVEWDAAGAAADMLPSVRDARLAEGELMRCPDHRFEVSSTSGCPLNSGVICA